MNQGSIARIRDEIGCGIAVAKELLILAGEDEELVVECAAVSGNLSECKARILDERFLVLEQC